MSEDQPHRQLDLSRTAESPRRGSHRGRNGAAYRGRDFAKARAALVRNGIGKIGVVEQIEEIGAYRQFHTLGAQRDGLQRRQIPVEESWAVILIASRGSGAAGGRSLRKIPRVEGSVRIAVVGR